MSVVRLAMVGAGRQCTKSLMPAIPFIPEIDLMAVCDLQRELAQRNARHFGARAAYTDVTEMLRQEAPDAAMVVGPPQMHEEIGLQVLEVGAHLWIEKPAAPTVEGAKRLVDGARRAGKMLRHLIGPLVRVAAVRRLRSEPGRGSAKVYQVIVEGAGGASFLNLQDSFDGWTAGPQIVGVGQGIVTVDDLGRVTFRRGEKRVPAEGRTWGNSAYTWEPHHTLPH